MYLADDFILTWILFKEVSNQQTLWLELPRFSFETRLNNIQMEIPILEQGASKLWTAEHRAWNSVRNFPLESTTPSTRNWPTRLLFYFCAKPVFFFIPKILLFLTRVHFNWWLIDPLLTASWLNMVLETAFRCWLRNSVNTELTDPTTLLFFVSSQFFFFIPKILLFPNKSAL